MSQPYAYHVHLQAKTFPCLEYPTEGQVSGEVIVGTARGAKANWDPGTGFGDPGGVLTPEIGTGLITEDLCADGLNAVNVFDAPYADHG
jgi:hypothetical protein